MKIEQFFKEVSHLSAKCSEVRLHPAGLSTASNGQILNSMGDIPVYVDGSLQVGAIQFRFGEKSFLIDPPDSDDLRNIRLPWYSRLRYGIRNFLGV